MVESRYLVALLFSMLTIIAVSALGQHDKDRTRFQQIRKIWDDVKTTPKFADENFYEFVNRVTHGEMFNLSVEAHAILEKEGHHHPPYSHDVIPDFNCILTNHTRRKPRNVHELTPYDVDVIAAFGDSLTAAFGAKAYTPIDLFIEYRGVSWSIGGDETIRTVLTLPNIIKEYNPKLRGYSTGISPPLIRIKDEQLDVAVSGNTAYGLMKQAKRFVEKMVTDPQYDFFGSWKVLTLFIGGNDLCSCCRQYKNYKEKYSAPNFIKEVTATLDYLQERVPKLFVNLVTPPNVTILQDLASPWCDFTHLLECKCGTVFGEKNREFTSHVLDQYDKGYADLINSGSYDKRDDFTVVLQPFFDHTIIPRTPDGAVDRTFFAPDCFHFSHRAHAASALALWNAMLEPVGKKVRTWRPYERFHCPTEKFPYFYTRINSNKSTTTTSQDTVAQLHNGSFGDWVQGLDPMYIMAIVMLVIFSICTVRLLTRERRVKISIAERDSREQSPPFFSGEVKKLHY